MSTGSAESLIFLALTLGYFVLIGVRDNALRTSDAEFWMAGGGMDVKRLSANWAAGSISLGLTTMYYMQMAAYFGWQIFLISIFTYLVGQLLFRHVARRWNSSHPSNVALVSNTLSAVFDRRIITVLGQVSGLLSILAMLYAEVYFGSAFLVALLGVVSPVASTALFVMTMVGVAAYVLIGGMRAVVDTDRLQMLLIWIAMSVFVIVGAALLANGVRPATAPQLPWFSTKFSRPDTTTYFIFGLLVNTLPLLCQNSFWQMVASSRSNDVPRGALWGILKSFLYFCVIILVAFVLNGTGKAFGPNMLLDTVRGLGEMGTHVLLPLLFVGLAAAMLSTCDSLIISSALSIKILLCKPLEDRGSSSKVRERIMLVSSVALLEVFLYIVVTNGLGIQFNTYFLPLVFFLFSQAAPFGLIILLSVLTPHRLRRANVVVIGILVAWATDMVAFLTALICGMPKVQFVVTPIAVTILLLIAFSFRSSTALADGGRYEPAA